MPTFRYVAVDGAGRRIAGELVEDSARAVIARLRESGQFPARVDLAGENAAATVPAPRCAWFSRISSGEMAVFCRQMSNLVRGGLPIVDAFGALIEHTENERLREVLAAVRSEVQAGSALWESLAKHPRVFSPLFVSMVRAGEASGELPMVLAWLATLTEQDQARRVQVQAATAYPKLLVAIGTAAVIFLVTFMIPRFVELFAEMEQALPAPTLALMAISSVASRWWSVIAAGAGVAWLFLRHYAGTPGGRTHLDRIRLRLPVAGKIARKMSVARMARTLATLLRGGVPILEALDVSRGVLSNEVLARGLDEAARRVRKGERLAESLRAGRLYPPLLLQMIGVGEETGDLPGALDTVATTYEVELDAQMKGLLALLEPAIILIMGGVVAFIITAMVWPMFELNPSGG